MSAAMETLRQPPCAIEAEQDVLGGIMLVPESLAKISDWLSPEDFYRREHRLIYAALLAMAEKREPIDAVTMGARMEADGSAVDVGGAAYLCELANNTVSAANIVSHAEIVLERSRLRKMIEIGTQIAGRGFDPREDSEAIVADALRRLAEIQSSRIRGGLKTTRELLSPWMKSLQESYYRRDAITGLRTPWAELNSVTHGLQPGDLIVIAARPNMGKSVMGAQLAEFVATELGVRTAVFALEPTATQLLNRITAMRGSVAYRGMTSPACLNETDWSRIADVTSRLYSAPLLIDDTPGLSAMQIQGRARRAHMQAPIGLIVVDHLHEIELPGRTSAERARDLGHAAGLLKALGKDFGCPVVALAQLNRELLNRGDKHPQMSDLRESGAIEEKADVILFLHREDYYDKKTHLKGVVDVEIGKGRDIETGTRVQLRHRFDVMRLDDWEGDLPLPPKIDEEATARGLKRRYGNGRAWN